MDEKETRDEPSWKERHEYAAIVEETKVSIFFSPFYTKLMFSEDFILHSSTTKMS